MPRKYPLPIAIGINLNAGRQCSHPSCHQPRFRIGAYCEHHSRLVKEYGHPDGRYVSPKEYQHEAHEVAEFLKQNLTHAGVVAALSWIDEWQNMTISSDPDERAKQPAGIDVMNRLRIHGVTPLDVLTEATSLWLYSYRFPSKLMDDKRLTYALSRALYNKAPAPKRELWKSGRIVRQRMLVPERNGIGGRIRDTLGLLILNIISTIHARQAAKESIKASFCAPFDAPISHTHSPLGKPQ